MRGPALRDVHGICGRSESRLTPPKEPKAPKPPDWLPLVDSREQYQLPLPGAVVGTLPAGDYSLVLASGQEMWRWCAVERKSAPDLAHSLGTDRPRFLREMERLRAIPYRALLIEAEMSYLLHRTDDFTLMHPSSILGSLVAIAWEYAIPVWTCTRADAPVIVMRMLQRAYDEIVCPRSWRLQREDQNRVTREAKMQTKADESMAAFLAATPALPDPRKLTSRTTAGAALGLVSRILIEGVEACNVADAQRYIDEVSRRLPTLGP